MTRTVGVEEELLLVDPESGKPVAVAAEALAAVGSQSASRQAGPGGLVEEELQQEQIETDTRPCRSLAELGREVRQQRASASKAARAAGAEVAALATSPIEVQPTTTPKSRYGQMVRSFGVTGMEQLCCGMHVHVEVDGDDEGVAVLDRIRVWLPVLLALSVNSPFQQGRATGYESFRSQSWSQWPSAGPYGLFGTAEIYQRAVQALVDTGTILDVGMVYFDARLSDSFPTIEIRVADVCMEADDAVAVAGLSRALVQTAAAEWRQGVPAADVRTEVLRVATWRAGHSGLTGALVDPRTATPVPAGVAVDALVDHVRPALEEYGDLDSVTELLTALRTRGTGAARQRETYRRAGRLQEVVRLAVEVTAPG